MLNTSRLRTGWAEPTVRTRAAKPAVIYGDSMPAPAVRTRLLALLAIFGLIAAACGSDGSSDEAAEPATTTAAPAETEEAEEPEPEAEEPEAEEEEEAAEEAVVDEVEEEEPAEDADPFGAVTETVETFIAAQGLEGAGLVIVEKDAGVVYEEHFGTFAPERISLIASASKMISAGVLLSLQEDGLLDINAPIEGQVDWATGNPDITPAQLISNSSGLVGLGPDLLYGPYLCQWGVPNTLQECGATVFSGTDDDADQIPPDTEFRYGGAQWQVAGAVAESVSGKTWDELIDEIYVEPCGVDSLGYISLGAVLTGAPGYPTSFAGDPDGVTVSANPNIEGGAHIDSGDYAKLLLMHLRGGECDGTPVLSQASLDTMHADRVAAAYDGEAGFPDFGYGMGWWVDRNTGRISDGGAWGVVPWLDLDDGYGAYLVIEEESDTGQALKTELEELVHTAVTGA
jgi:CubicO group peptidase (beta-lactamase class C family)